MSRSRLTRRSPTAASRRIGLAGVAAGLLSAAVAALFPGDVGEETRTTVIAARPLDPFVPAAFESENASVLRMSARSKS